MESCWEDDPPGLQSLSSCSFSLLDMISSPSRPGEVARGGFGLAGQRCPPPLLRSCLLLSCRGLNFAFLLPVIVLVLERLEGIVVIDHIAFLRFPHPSCCEMRVGGSGLLTPCSKI